MSRATSSKTRLLVWFRATLRAAPETGVPSRRRARADRPRRGRAHAGDGQTAESYAEHLEENLTTLLKRWKAGSYHAPPVRRAYIPKVGSPKGRPIGVPTFEDKVLQRTVAMVLEAV
ncbi:hypothetical protein B4Q13_23600, partial [Lacticaseibacillus rhamnosus]